MSGGKGVALSLQDLEEVANIIGRYSGVKGVLEEFKKKFGIHPDAQVVGPIGGPRYSGWGVTLKVPKGIIYSLVDVSLWADWEDSGLEPKHFTVHLFGQRREMEKQKGAGEERKIDPDLPSLRKALLEEPDNEWLDFLKDKMPFFFSPKTESPS